MIVIQKEYDDLCIRLNKLFTEKQVEGHSLHFTQEGSYHIVAWSYLISRDFEDNKTRIKRYSHTILWGSFIFGKYRFYLIDKEQLGNFLSHDYSQWGYPVQFSYAELKKWGLQC